MKDIKEMEEEYKDVLSQLADPEMLSDLERFEELSKKKKQLESIIEKQREIEEITKRINENEAMLQTGEDHDLMVLAQDELPQLKEKLEVLKKELEGLLKEESTPSKSNSVIIEIRAGAGGEEAALFVSDLYRMYSRYADNQNWKRTMLDSHATDIGGFKEIVFELSPGHSEVKDIFSKMKYEGGVHRVQRIPETEKTGRVHTSTVSVAVLMIPKKTDIKIKSQDLRIDIAKASGPGGQNVNKRMTAVRITHIPTGIMVKSMTERSLPQNKENAMAILSAKLLEMKETEETSKISSERKEQIGGAKRAEKIRTYNFPQDRVTDHRIKKSFHNIEKIMEGELEPIIKALA